MLRDPRPPGVPRSEVARELARRLPARSAQALILTGVRRSGKSVLQAQVMRGRKGAVYCNLEDTRLFGFSPADFAAFLGVLEEVSPAGGPVYLDEVQEVPEWQRLVRALLDRGRTVCATGSNASLLGKDLGTKLTGRHLSFEVFPFSYREFLSFTAQRPGRRSLEDFLDRGGFPAHLRERNPAILQELLRDVVQRDIASRHGLRETRHVMNLALYLMANTGQPFSFQSLTKSLAVPSVAQTSRYVEYLQDGYLVFGLPRWSPSFRKRVVAPAKYYAVDNGLRRAASPQPNRDLGHRLENAVFLALRRERITAAYAAEKDAWECDFVTGYEALQCCAELTPFNREREVRGLARACALPGPKRRPVILTVDQRDRFAAEGLRIEVRPAWDWLAARP